MNSTIQKYNQLESKLKEAKLKESSKDYDNAIQLYKSILSNNEESINEDSARLKEDAIYRLADIYATLKKSNELVSLNQSVRPLFKYLPKAKTAKIVNTIIKLVGTIENSLDIQIEICEESVEWTKLEKRTFLRHRIQSRLASLYFQKEEYTSSLNLINKLLREVRKLDDKSLLVEIHLMESHVQHALKNIAKARAGLTAARTSANAIYCPPLLQAELDMQSGILHAEEKDYKTGYSYFYEAFEGYSSIDDSNAVLALKYMLLCKVMINQTEDVQQILSSKNALKYSGNEVEAMRSISSAYQERSLHLFEDSLKKYQKELVDDKIIQVHLNELYEALLEQHLIRIIEPFSRVQVSHIAKLINLPQPRIETKLSQMILDKKLHGTIDQGNDCLIIFDETNEVDMLYPSALETLTNMDNVVDSLFDRAKLLTN